MDLTFLKKFVYVCFISCGTPLFEKYIESYTAFKSQSLFLSCYFSLGKLCVYAEFGNMIILFFLIFLYSNSTLETKYGN